MAESVASGKGFGPIQGRFRPCRTVAGSLVDAYRPEKDHKAVVMDMSWFGNAAANGAYG